ncbi:MAG: hypothetical protein LLF94_05090 [Chlamydiales bacterium]|nr:hypothetical protein [Chlamydiales bacterium]
MTSNIASFFQQRIDPPLRAGAHYLDQLEAEMPPVAKLALTALGACGTAYCGYRLYEGVTISNITQITASFTGFVGGIIFTSVMVSCYNTRQSPEVRP